MSKHHHGGVKSAVAEVAKNANPITGMISLIGILDPQWLCCFAYGCSPYIKLMSSSGAMKIGARYAAHGTVFVLFLEGLS